MPNWATTQIKCKEKGNKFRELAEYVEGRNGDFDFNKIVPMPKTLNLTEGSITDNAILHVFLLQKNRNRIKEIKSILQKVPSTLYGNKMVEIFSRTQNNITYLQDVIENANKYFPSDEEKKLGVKTLEDLGNLYLDNAKKYGYFTWYDWSCENWGTKWNADASEVDVINKEIYFQTAWSCPMPILIKLSHKFPTIEFEVHCEYEGEDEYSEFVLKNGEAIKGSVVE